MTTINLGMGRRIKKYFTLGFFNCYSQILLRFLEAPRGEDKAAEGSLELQ